MRLTCPKCSVEYEVAGGRIPQAGRHVQCSACHTRWFVDGRPRTPPSEDQIIRRLETWRPRPVAVPDPVPVPEPVVAAESPLPAGEVAENFVWEAQGPEPEAEAAAPAVAAETAAADPPPAAPAEAAGPAEPPPARAPLRLDLTAGAAHAPAQPRTPGRFARGLGLALVVFAAALTLYLGAGAIAARLPAAGPALGAYAALVDGLRESLAERLGGGDTGG